MLPFLIFNHETDVFSDLHLGDIGLAIPGLSDQDLEEVIAELGTHDLTVGPLELLCVLFFFLSRLYTGP